MSIRIMAQVWDSSPFEGRALLVELALADFANDEGVCWPSVETLAKKARCSESWVHQIIRDLKKAGRLFVAEQGGRGKTNTYKLDPFTSEKGALDAPFSPKGAVSVAKRVQPTAPDPSLEPSYNNIKGTARELDAMASAFARYGLCTAGTAQAIEWSVEEHGVEWVWLSIRKAASAGLEEKPAWSYVDKIAARLKKQGHDDEPKEFNDGRIQKTRQHVGRGAGGGTSSGDVTRLWLDYAAGKG
jgi:hypothetical protein